MKKILFAFALIGLTGVSVAQFNGSLEFTYITVKDTTKNVYLVKDKLVKLDQFGKKTGTIEGSFIFDLEAGKIRFVNPKRKVWGDHVSETQAIVKGKCEVNKTGNTKTIQGIKCSEYVVKNTTENTVVTYWICNDKFNFFIPMLKLWNRKDKQSIYFHQITGLPEGSMPMLSEEKQISDNKLLTRLEVTKIGKKTPSDSELQVPADYTKFDK